MRKKRETFTQLPIFFSLFFPTSLPLLEYPQLKSSMTSNNTNTRLLITSLHPSVTAQHLRSHLSQCPSLQQLSPSSSITDVKVVTRKDGTSRCLAFVGFKDGKQAEKVLEWSKGSWLNGTNGGSRIRVDWAKDVSLSLR